MEAVEEPPVKPTVDNIKVSIITDEATDVSLETEKCHKSNGVAEQTTEKQCDTIVTETIITESNNSVSETEIASDTPNEVAPSSDSEPIVSVVHEIEVTASTEDVNASVLQDQIDDIISKNNEHITEIVIDESDKITHIVEEIQTAKFTQEISNIDLSKDTVTFKTEVLVEKHENDVNETIVSETDNCNNTNNILSELGQNIELSEVLRSSDITENVENNNCSVRQEVLNNEELLDILEGNDMETPENEINVQIETTDVKSLEAQLALQQLSRLKKRKYKGNKSLDKFPRKSRGDKKTDVSNATEIKKKDNIVNVLVKDWEDDEPLEEDQPNKLSEESKGSHELIKIQETVENLEEPSLKISDESSTNHVSENQSPNLKKSGEENQPQRRLGRVIKKKVIFDPDNPDTFTKGKTVTKNKETSFEKEISSSKKTKSDQTPQRSKSKSPTTKLQWKKPPPKNNKQNKRLTEIDKLLMDEGAVNMIYQLTPEAPKGKKNMKTKAEFIKKIQSSTPDSKEMKFRERKKEFNKGEETEAKKILGVKHRASLSSSVKSPLACEDFETHSADDSIIYRRHSSSSYSSACMSPLRCDVEVGVNQSATRISRQSSEDQNQIIVDAENGDQTDVFMSDSTNVSNNEIINKSDCLSIKEKLNSKLSLALNKRKREGTKIDKPPKQKKVLKTQEREELNLKQEDIPRYKSVSINYYHKVAEICIQKSGSKYSSETLRELEQALLFVDGKKDISITLLTSECGALCSSLDLYSLLDDNVEKRIKHAHEIAESVRSLLCCLEDHSKLVFTGVWGVCSGVALALVALSDIVVASESATFTLAGDSTAPMVPGLSIITSHFQIFPRNMLNDLVVFGRQLSAAEALRNGLVSRTLWPNRFVEQLRALVKDIATQPKASLLLKKKILRLRRSGESETTFQSCLETERDLFTEYWTSTEGQELIRNNLNVS